MWAALPLVSVQLPLLYGLLFGALISPTDPIAVMGIFRSAGAPKNLELVMAGYALASHLRVSRPLAMVVCGLMIGNGGRALAMSDHTRRCIDMFWELVDEILNAVLFVLIGLEVLLIAFTAPILVAGLIAIGVTCSRSSCRG